VAPWLAKVDLTPVGGFELPAVGAAPEETRSFLVRILLYLVDITGGSGIGAISGRDRSADGDENE
jgi:hypothetical protein